MQLSFIIVNHHSEQYLAPCVKSILDSQLPLDFEIIIINSATEKAEVSFSQKNIQIIEAGENLGFGKANNLAAKRAAGKYLCFLNPDTLLFPKQEILSLLNMFITDPTIGAIGPRLVTNADTLTTQAWSAGKEITFWDVMLNNMGLIKSRRIWESKDPILAAWVSGAALFIKSELFSKLNGFDEGFFMYFEDVDLCKRVRELGQNILYFPTYAVFHWSGKSSSHKKQQKTTYYKSQDYYFEKNFGKNTALLLKVIRSFMGLFSTPA